MQFRRIFVRTGDDRSEEAAQSLVQSLHGKLQADPSRFRALAHEYSDDPNKRRGGDVGYVGRDGRLGLPQGGRRQGVQPRDRTAIEPFEAGGGLNLIQVTARRDAMDRTYEQMKGSVLRKLKNERVEEQTKAYVATIRKDIDVEIDEALLTSVKVEARPVPPGGLDPSVLSGMPGRPSIGSPVLGPSHPAVGVPAGRPRPRRRSGARGQRVILLFASAVASAGNGVVDKVAAVVGDDVISLSEIYELAGSEFFIGRCPTLDDTCVTEAELENPRRVVARC